MKPDRQSARRTSAILPSAILLRSIHLWLGLILCSLTVAPCVQAKPRGEDFQIWAGLTGSGAISQDVELRADGVFIASNNAKRAGRELLRVVLLTKVDDRLMIGGGYVWTHVELVGGRRFTEHRAVQELSFRSSVAANRTALALRTQMEERWRVGEARMSLRLRQLTRLDIPVRPTKLRAVVWNEYFHELRTTSWAGPAGPGLMLNFAGVHIPVGERVTIEPGYLNQTQFEKGPNPVSHAAALFVRVRF